MTGAHVVVGQSLDYVAVTQHNILTAEMLIGPVLLLAVFFGALIVGRGGRADRARPAAADRDDRGRVPRTPHPALGD